MLRATVLALLILAGAACDDSPTSPSSSFALSCPAPVTVQSTSATTQVTYPAPTATGGQAPVTTSCTPASGSAFPAGTTVVNCQATDSRSQTSTCRATITVVRLPTLQGTRFVAFGDSITAGEVTVPIGPMSDPNAIVPTIVVPSASYPSRLLPQLQARYTTQAGELVMVNEGKPGESALSGVPRLGQVLANGNYQVLLLLQATTTCSGRAPPPFHGCPERSMTWRVKGERAVFASTWRC
jgi:HYR domain